VENGKENVMPHVVIEGDVDLEELFQGFEPLHQRDDGGIRKVSDAFLNSQNTSILLESVVVENGSTQKFMIAIGTKGSGATVRLFPLTDPQKTPGVKRLMADVARQIVDRFPGTKFGKTNLQDFLRTSLLRKI
jgi:hypothetical protein